MFYFSNFYYSLCISKSLKAVSNSKLTAINPSCSPSIIYCGLSICAYLELNPLCSVQLRSQPSYPITVSLGNSVTKTGNNFDIKVLTKMKLFHVKGIQTNNKFNVQNNKEVLTLTTEILSNRDRDLTIDIGLITSVINFHLNNITYSDKAHLERNDDHIRIELHCLMILDKSSSQTGYDSVYERKNNKGNI
ncbi:unnamed protein product [Rotaria sp. Silwood2]|nr:unnamed protein product [Rotaria sp. Silwood2]CAF4242100.1 unnamed protein product [Rotaria sp. Silwood2]